MLKLWGRVNSINVQKVLWALEELKVPYERTDAGMAFGVVNEPFYKKMNPNSRVPTIDDDGFVLWESNAIVRYLAAKHGAGSLSPNDPKQRANSDRWMDWASNHVGPVITPVFWGLIRTRLRSAIWRRSKPTQRRLDNNSRCSSRAWRERTTSQGRISLWATSLSA